MSSAAESSQNSRTFNGRTLILMVVSFMCGSLFCATLLLTSGFYFMQEQLNPFLATSVVQTGATPLPTSVLTPTLPPENSPTPAPALPTATTMATALPPVAITPTTKPAANKPEFTNLVFALDATDEDYTPIQPGVTFTAGITEIHAIFDYVGMNSASTWERVWYLNDEEILRNSATWSGQAEGRFDYFIDAGGTPLPSGQWRLELFVNRLRLISGTFAIGELPTPTSAATMVSPMPPTPLVVVVTATPTPVLSVTTTSPNQVYQVVFTKWDGGQHNLYVADTNGNNEKFILNRAAGPSWTPDGQEIFFYGEEGIDRQILKDRQEWLFDGISNGLVSLTNAASLPDPTKARLFQDISWKRGAARWANVSPDGYMVAFDAWVENTYRLFIMPTNPADQTRFEMLGEQGDWSPDSQRLVYRSGRNGTTGLWISRRNDSEHVLVTANGSDSFPAWSPDGLTIVFSRDEGANVDLYAMNPDGSNIRRLTNASGPDTLPVFMPNGQLVFRSARNGYWSIWKMSLDGTNQTEFIANAPVGPDWSYSRMDVR